MPKFFPRCERPPREIYVRLPLPRGVPCSTAPRPQDQPGSLHRRLEIPQLAAEASLELVDVVRFRHGDWPGYRYVGSRGQRPVSAPDFEPSYTFCFARTGARRPSVAARLYPVCLARAWALAALLPLRSPLDRLRPERRDDILLKWHGALPPAPRVAGDPVAVLKEAVLMGALPPGRIDAAAEAALQGFVGGVAVQAVEWLLQVPIPSLLPPKIQSSTE